MIEYANTSRANRLVYQVKGALWNCNFFLLANYFYLIHYFLIEKNMGFKTNDIPFCFGHMTPYQWAFLMGFINAMTNASHSFICS